MEFLISASTDIGIKKDTNQDGLLVRSFKFNGQRGVFAVLCDGMGGLAKGELASTDTVEAFGRWMQNVLPTLLVAGLTDSEIRRQWSALVNQQNQRIMRHSHNLNLNMGTTIVAALFTEQRYYMMNVGDSRGYELHNGIRQLTKDHTVVAKEVEDGILTPEEARTDPRRNVLLQCIGASDVIYPGFYFGETAPDAVYLFCSDGFVHEISEYEMYQALGPEQMLSAQAMREATLQLIETDKARDERDNISVITIRTF